MNPSFDFPTPDHFTTGTVGPTGRRTFFLQVGQGTSIASFKVEKQQVEALADYLTAVLADLPDDAAVPLPLADLVEPVVPEWTVGGIGIAYDESVDRILLLVHEVPTDDDPDDSDEDDEAEVDFDFDDESGLHGATARIQLTRAQVASFIDRGRELVAAGRPLCPFCGLPDGPDGHFCPRAN